MFDYMYWIKKYAWVVLVAVVVLWFMLGNSQGGENKTEGLIDIDETKAAMTVEKTGNEGKLMVDIKGEVAKPGIYELEEGSRVHDAVTAAGGMTPEADPASVNLAQSVSDEMMIIVNGMVSDDSEGAQFAENSKIRINYADITEIQTLNGIGESKAKAIVQHREDNGLFQTVEDLLEVSGIGEKTLENIKDSIQIP